MTQFRRSTAWITLLAMLFSAVSPAVAAGLFSNQPEIAGQILGIPAASVQPAHEDECANESGHHGDTGGSGSTHDSAPHKAHGIYCSFCLNAGSTVALSGATPALVIATLSFDVSPPQLELAFRAAFIAVYRSRAPPLIVS